MCIEPAVFYAMDADAIATAVKREIERQQANVDYDAMATDELERTVKMLQERLAMCQRAAASERSKRTVAIVPLSGTRFSQGSKERPSLLRPVTMVCHR